MISEHFLCCPGCKKDLLYLKKEHAGNGEPAPYYQCEFCNRDFFRKEEGYWDFYPEYDNGKTGNQKAMESKKIVTIYESEKWRRSKLFTNQMGLSLKEEMELIDRIASPGDADMILDLACGPGLYTRYFAKAGPKRKVIGYDLSRPMLNWAAAKVEEENISNIVFLHGDAHLLPFKDEVFDVVNCTGAFHNFSNIPAVMAEVFRVLKKGGRLSLAVVLNKGTLLHKFNSWFYKIFFSTHFFKEEELLDLLKEAGFYKPAIYHAKKLWMIAGGEKSKK